MQPAHSPSPARHAMQCALMGAAQHTPAAHTPDSHSTCALQTPPAAVRAMQLAEVACSVVGAAHAAHRPSSAAHASHCCRVAADMPPASQHRPPRHMLPSQSVSCSQ
ncbi:MAG: hypothetical protein EOO41_04145 [Methanobacteriota archaeon]|nr:MAG: hypothetical protein EOO41_04145 [Euryarchaeota archaeon]